MKALLLIFTLSFSTTLLALEEGSYTGIQISLEGQITNCSFTVTRIDGGFEIELDGEKFQYDDKRSYTSYMCFDSFDMIDYTREDVAYYPVCGLTSEAPKDSDLDLYLNEDRSLIKLNYVNYAGERKISNRCGDIKKLEQIPARDEKANQIVAADRNTNPDQRSNIDGSDQDNIDGSTRE